MGVYIKIDEQLHNIFDAIKNHEVYWRDFHEVGMDEPYYDYYYAEDELYIIRDRIGETYYFVKARSPEQAMGKYKEGFTILYDSVEED